MTAAIVTCYNLSVFSIT